MKLEKIENYETGPDLMFICPGCDGMYHGIWTKNQRPGSNWGFNGDMDKPTFTPSVLVQYPYAGKDVVCHSFVRDGKIQYLNDCTHHLKGQTVELPEIE